MVGNPLLEIGRSGRYAFEIDALKAAAILSVVVLHAIPITASKMVGAPFHASHAMVVFIMVSAFHLAARLDRENPRPGFPRGFYSAAFFRGLATRLLVPFAVVLGVQVVIATARGATAGEILCHLAVTGGYGPGSYFPWVFVQHLLVFPFIYLAAGVGRGGYANLGLAFLLAIALDALCVAAGLPGWLYRLVFIRYVFAVFLGVGLARWEWIDLRVWIPLGMVGAMYLAATHYFRFDFTPLLYPSWRGSHAPGYLYTFVLCLFLLKAAGRIGRSPVLSVPIAILGRASYHIYLAQLLVFWLSELYVRPHLPLARSATGVLHLAVTLPLEIICSLVLGLLLYHLPHWLPETVRRRRGAS